MPPTYTWCRRGQRPLVPHESPQGQRVNVLAALAAPGTTPATPLIWWAAPWTWKSEHLLTFLRLTLPPGDGTRRVVVLDNASHHGSRVIRDAQPDLKKQGIELWYLPPYAPELNDIERRFRDAKHQALPVRTYATVRRLTAAIHTGFRTLQNQILSEHSSMRTA